MKAACTLALTVALTTAEVAQGQAARPSILGVSHIAVYSANAEATRQFYAHDLGASRGPDAENAVGVRYWFNGAQFVEVLPLPAGYTGKSRMDHVAFQTTDAEGMRQYLAAHGQAVPAAVMVGTDGSKWFAIKDPEGNRVEFVQAGAPGPDVTGVAATGTPATGPISRHMIHLGYIVRDEPAVERFYTGLLGFRPYWHGGPTDAHSEWFSMQAPNGLDWVELMQQDQPAAVTAQVTGILNHFALGVNNIEQTDNVLYAGGRLGPRSSDPKIGRDGKWQVNLYDPDGTRAELMEFEPAVKPCCSPYLQPSPTGVYPEIVRLQPGLDALIAPGTIVERVATSLRFTEGPMPRQGRLWVSDVVADKVLAIAPDGKVDTLVERAGGYPSPPDGSYLGPNAMVADKDGTVLLAQQGGRALVRITADLKEQPFLSIFEGHKFNSPNDLVFGPDGALWFTDPPYGLEGMDKSPLKEVPFNGVYRYAKGRLTAPIRELTLPNGLGFSPDGKTLYVCNSGPRMAVWAYPVAADGTTGAGRVLIEFHGDEGRGVPDGMKVDRLGNVWTTGPGGIRIVTPDGKVLGMIRLPETAANLAWADDGNTLYITAQNSVYRVRVKGIGVMPLYAR